MSEVTANNSEKLENSVHGQGDEVAKPVTATVNNTNIKEASAAEAPVAGDSVGDTAKAEIAEESTISPKIQNKKTPVKRTPTKRMSFIERAQKESEELVKNLGGSLELEGGRRTRSSTRGTPTRSAVVATPPPAKKARASPAANITATPPSRRGRGRKIDISNEPLDTESTSEGNKKTEAADEIETVKPVDSNDSEKSSAENAENSVVDAANSAAAAEEKQLLEIPKNTDNVVSLDSNSDAKADATLDSVPEEKQNNVDHCVEKMEDEKTDSAMETDDDAKPSSESEAAAATTEPVKEIKDTSTDVSTSPTDTVAVVIEKEPTLEPMEVDSSSSNDNIESTLTTAENVNQDIPEPNIKTTGSTGEAQVADVQVTQNPDAQTDAPVVSEIVKDGEALLPVTTDETTSESVIINDETSTVAAVEPETTVNSTSDTTVEENTNKSENDLCEPKIVSPSKTSDGPVSATPQYCN